MPNVEMKIEVFVYVWNMKKSIDRIFQCMLYIMETLIYFSLRNTVVILN